MIGRRVAIFGESENVIPLKHDCLPIMARYWLRKHKPVGANPAAETRPSCKGLWPEDGKAIQRKAAAADPGFEAQYNAELAKHGLQQDFCRSTAAASLLLRLAVTRLPAKTRIAPFRVQRSFTIESSLTTLTVKHPCQRWEWANLPQTNLQTECMTSN
jgi:hypothetical protein